MMRSPVTGFSMLSPARITGSSFRGFRHRSAGRHHDRTKRLRRACSRLKKARGSLRARGPAPRRRRIAEDSGISELELEVVDVATTAEHGEPFELVDHGEMVGLALRG